MAAAAPADAKLARRLVLDELIPVETRHHAFWQSFFGLELGRLDLGRRLKLALILAVCRLFGAPAIHLILESIEVHGVRKYLAIWHRYGAGPLGGAVREVLRDEFEHEDRVVTGDAERRINPERIRGIFLGLNDGLVEILGAVSGFFAAFGASVTVLVAGLTVAVAGALSMAAGAYAGASSASVRATEEGRRRFLGERPAEDAGESPLTAAVVVGASYFAGALVPVLPVLAGARTALPSVLTAGTVIVVVSALLAFLSGMDVRRRVVMNGLITALAVLATYAIGLAANALLGVSVV